MIRGCGPFCCLEFYLCSLREKVKTGEKERLSSLTELLTPEETCDRPVCTKHQIINAPMTLMPLTPCHIPLLSCSTNLFLFFFYLSNLSCLACHQFLFTATLLYCKNITSQVLFVKWLNVPSETLREHCTTHLRSLTCWFGSSAEQC